MVRVGEKERAPITLKPLYEVHCGGSVGAPFSGCYLPTLVIFVSRPSSSFVTASLD